MVRREGPKGKPAALCLKQPCPSAPLWPPGSHYSSSELRVGSENQGETDQVPQDHDWAGQGQTNCLLQGVPKWH